MPLVTDLLATPPSTVTVNPACSHSLHPIDNDHFHGRLMLKLRPPNFQPHSSTQQQKDKLAHCPSSTTAGITGPAGGAVSSEGSCDCCSDFFYRHPAVQMELSVQGRFLHPVSRVWMGAELGGSPTAFTLTLPMLKRALIRVMANIIATFIPNVKWTLGDKVLSDSTQPLTSHIQRHMHHSTPLHFTPLLLL